MVGWTFNLTDYLGTRSRGSYRTSLLKSLDQQDFVETSLRSRVGGVLTGISAVGPSPERSPVSGLTGLPCYCVIYGLILREVLIAGRV